MKTEQCWPSLGRAVLTGVGILLILAAPAQAQFTGSYQTNVISGEVSGWPGDYFVGSNTVFDLLRIINNGVLVSGAAHIGYAGTSNAAVISGTGSVWNTTGVYVGDYPGSGNSLVISNGGIVANESVAFIGRNGNNSNSVLVSGSGSLWSNVNDLSVGFQTSGNSLVISNGGIVVSRNCYIGDSGDNTNNSVLVTGNGSVWNNPGSINVGNGGISNSLVISDGGVVISGSGFIGFPYLAPASSVLVSGSGSVWSNQSNLYVGYQGSRNSLVISNGGAVVSSTVIVSPNNSVTLNSGNLIAASGLVISSNAVLKGTGTIHADLTLAGTLAPGNSPGALTNFGNVTLQSSAVLDFELGGTTQGVEYDFLLVTNGVATLDGLLQVSFINGFETNALNSDIFTLLTADTLTGSFTNVLTGQRLMTLGGEGSFLVDYRGNTVVLSDYQAVPEPATWALGAVGLIVLFGSRRFPESGHDPAGAGWPSKRRLTRQ